MIEISPVLAGTTNAPDYVPASTNVTTGGEVRKTTDAGTADLSFGDFLDMINPLQHIPVVSSVYRAISGDTINPVSRVAGDILFSGPLGIASVLASGAGAIADTVMEAKTGKDMAGTMVAALFGDDGAASTTPPTTQLADAAEPANTAASPTADTTPAAVAQADSAPAATPATVAATPTADANTTPQTLAKSFPLDRKKMAFGGVMAPIQPAASNGIRIGSTIYTSPLLNGKHPVPVATATAAAASVDAAQAAAVPVTAPSPTVTAALPASPIPASVTANSGTGSTTGQSLPANLSDDALILRALNMYKSVAQSSGGTGSTLDSVH